MYSIYWQKNGYEYKESIDKNTGINPVAYYTSFD